MNLISKILKESEDLFQPRRIKDRINTADSLTKKMFSEFSKGTDILVWLLYSKEFRDGKIISEPWYSYNDWYVQSKFAGLPGSFTIYWNIDENRWEYNL